MLYSGIFYKTGIKELGLLLYHTAMRNLLICFYRYVLYKGEKKRRFQVALLKPFLKG